MLNWGSPFRRWSLTRPPPPGRPPDPRHASRGFFDGREIEGRGLKRASRGGQMDWLWPNGCAARPCGPAHNFRARGGRPGSLVGLGPGGGTLTFGAGCARDDVYAEWRRGEVIRRLNFSERAGALRGAAECSEPPWAVSGFEAAPRQAPLRPAASRAGEWKSFWMLTGDSLRAGSHANPPLATPQTPGRLRWRFIRRSRVPFL